MGTRTVVAAKLTALRREISEDKMVAGLQLEEWRGFVQQMEGYSLVTATEIHDDRVIFDVSPHVEFMVADRIKSFGYVVEEHRQDTDQVDGWLLVELRQAVTYAYANVLSVMLKSSIDWKSGQEAKALLDELIGVANAED